MRLEAERAAEMRMAFGANALREARRQLHRAMAEHRRADVDKLAAICLVLIRLEDAAAGLAGTGPACSPATSSL